MCGMVTRLKFIIPVLGIFCLFIDGRVCGQQSTFAGNAQHTAQYSVPAQPLNRARLVATNDLTVGGFAHYGAPLITAANTVLLPLNMPGGFKVDAPDGATGRLKYTLSTDY